MESDPNGLVITVDSPKKAPGALLTLEGIAQGVPREARASLDDEISAGGPPIADNIMGEAPSIETTIVSLLSARQFNLAVGGPAG